MRQLSITFILITLVMLLFEQPSYCAIKGGIKYSIPTDYSKLSETELNEKADKYYYLAGQLPDKTVNDDMTNALMLYSVLQNINPEEIKYSVRLGILYDKLDMGRYAKGNFSRAIGVKPSAYEPYYYMAEFYYKRAVYKNALKYYQKAETKAGGKNYDILYKIGDIYEKFGDTKTALKYLNDANAISPNSELEQKIKYIEAFDSANGKYYSK